MEQFSVFIAKNLGLFYAFAISVVALLAIEVMRAKRSLARVTPKDAVLLINKKNAVVVDIRAQDSFRTGHIVDAVSAPYSLWPDAAKKLDKYKAKPIIIVCGNGNDAMKAATTLAKQGFNAMTLGGGMRAWMDCELPMVKE